MRLVTRLAGGSTRTLSFGLELRVRCRRRHPIVNRARPRHLLGFRQYRRVPHDAYIPVCEAILGTADVPTGARSKTWTVTGRIRTIAFVALRDALAPHGVFADSRIAGTGCEPAAIGHGGSHRRAASCCDSSVLALSAGV
ncbi:hypothetical protein OG948_01695 [Embleya sp. NBC_00888]|uniref:hypothetical protein n=1 Tax=Embleya sp. NBC_00888 TaxID=2975960 RepID=UPI00386DE679|nr:hypothetical protein OG948_01695 [Embleya sp. NBC_00888]